ncbi:hypothetical protein [Persicobacter sp. CCB-QB2]|uniref:hypothetical protein n=1 Tax=Persicobacter sp. CCB-QB2 TaxID=1561025 RepID=UPI0006A9F26F|nr:hypothetical protein [Persicobacter sp. CCB-QB2]
MKQLFTVFIFVGLIGCTSIAEEVDPVPVAVNAPIEQFPKYFIQQFEEERDTILSFRYSSANRYIELDYLGQSQFFFAFDENGEFLSYTLRAQGVDIKSLKVVGRDRQTIRYVMEQTSSETPIYFFYGRKKLLDPVFEIEEQLSGNGQVERVQFYEFGQEKILTDEITFLHDEKENLNRLEYYQYTEAGGSPRLFVDFEYDQQASVFHFLEALPMVVILDILVETRLSAFSGLNNARKVSIEDFNLLNTFREENEYVYAYNNLGYPGQIRYITNRFGTQDSLNYLITYR